MKIEKTMTVEIDHGTVMLSWDSNDPANFSLSIDQGGDDRVWTVKHATLIDLQEACERMLSESLIASNTVRDTRASAARRRVVLRTCPARMIPLEVPFPQASKEDILRAIGMVETGKEPVLCRLEYIVVECLRASQPVVHGPQVDALERSLWTGSLGPIHVAKLHNFYVIVDGHHRATLAHRLKDKTILARVHVPFTESSFYGT